MKILLGSAFILLSTVIFGLPTRARDYGTIRSNYTVSFSCKSEPSDIRAGVEKFLYEQYFKYKTDNKSILSLHIVGFDDNNTIFRLMSRYRFEDLYIITIILPPIAEDNLLLYSRTHKLITEELSCKVNNETKYQNSLDDVGIFDGILQDTKKYVLNKTRT